MARWIASCAVAVVVAGGSAAAHHSIAGVYDGARETTVEGVIAEFQFVHPHPFVLLDVGRGGETERWHLEMDNRGELVQIGFSDTTLRPGDRLTVTGSLARRESHRLYIRQLARPADGFAYEQVGNRPRLRAPARKQTSR